MPSSPSWTTEWSLCLLLVFLARAFCLLYSKMLAQLLRSLSKPTVLTFIWSLFCKLILLLLLCYNWLSIDRWSSISSPPLPSASETHPSCHLPTFPLHVYGFNGVKRFVCFFIVLWFVWVIISLCALSSHSRCLSLCLISKAALLLWVLHL